MQKAHHRLKFKTLLALVLWLAATAPHLSWASDPPVNIVPYKKARWIALKARPGKLKNFELKQRKDIWVYDFNILSSDQVLHEVVIDAATGKVLLGAAKSKSKKHKKAKVTPTVSAATPAPTP